jgi:3-dehydroquinate dehydratase-2
MRRILVINGPNLNMLGRREPEIYGSRTLEDIREMCLKVAALKELEIEFRQSNHEGEIVTWIQEVMDSFDGLVINAAAYTHTSIAIHDALKLLSCPVIEVHLSDPSMREKFRHISYIEPVASAVVKGKGANSYTEAIEKIHTLITVN